jgi:hypothetical protein
MTRNVQLAFAVVAMFFGCVAVKAQTRGGGSPAMPARVAPMPIASAGRASGSPVAPISSGARAARQATVIQISPSGRNVSGTGSFANSFNFTGQNGVPGLGFDYPHLAAVGGNFRGNPPGFGSGMRHHRDFGGNFGAGILFGGFPYYSDFSDYQQEPQQQQQPQVIVIQQPVPAAPVEQSAAPSPDTIPQAAQPAPPPAPVREVGEFILVRRDGRVLFASVFSVTGTQVQYVTPEGIRRVLPLSELDTAATQQMNEARGTTLQFHN